MGTNIETNSSGEALLGPGTTPTIDARQAAFQAANACESKLAKSVVVLDVAKVTVLADYFVVAGADSVAQVKAIVDAVEDSLLKLGYKAKSIEGKREARWVLLDYGNVIVHVLTEKERNYYKIEQFWNHGLIVERQDWVQE